MQTVWFTALISAICLEGLGRRYLPMIPSGAFYFLKDVILLIGYWLYRPSPQIFKRAKYLYRGFGIVWLIAFLWTVAEIFNPSNQSLLLGVIGLRSYWLWWLAPMVIASALKERHQKEHAIYALLVLCLAIAALATVQFASPPDSSVNMYSVWNGEEMYAEDYAVVNSTGRARVASTFAFVSGFVDFTLLVPALLLSIGLDSENPKVRNAALVATFATAAVVPMSGSRSSIVVGVAILLLMLWQTGLFFTRIGRRILIGSVVAAVLAVAVFPEAFLGVQSRFQQNEDETRSRFEQLQMILPPLAMTMYEYPMGGIGTGMQQNAKATFGISSSPWDIEVEPGRYLVELGPAGYLLIWFAKVGFMVALFRSSRLLKRAGRRGSSAAALAYGALMQVGSLTFDHNWQALYFVGSGFILSEVLAVQRQAAAQRVPVSAAVPDPQPAKALAG